MRTIHIHPCAPSKPKEGEPCNGCGVCCVAEPCPLGVLISRRRHGACAALRWNDQRGVYRCGVLTGEAAAWVGSLPAPISRAVKAAAGRWISAGSGCDCSLEVERSELKPPVER